jgi:predicted nucleic acid-binding protein
VPAAAGPEAWLDAFGLCFAVLPVTARVAWTAAAFDWLHRDPCDRHILATAFVHRLPLVTVDPVIATFAPLRARCVTRARPMPEAPPVTSAVLPLRS